MSTSLSFRRLAPSELVAVHALEIDGFPTDEAASLSSLQQRLSLAPQLFIGAFVSPSLAVMEQEELPADSSSSGGREELIGYVCSTLTPSSTLTHASMKTHVPESAYVAIHSVCVAAAHRRQAVAGRMLEHYLMELRGMQGVKGARLITHDELVPLYTSAGFLLIGESDVVHGARKWHEMAIDFEEMREKAVPAVEVRSPGVLFDSFENGMRQLVDGEGLNSVDLYCPRGECRCLLLRKGAANWVTNGVGRSSFEVCSRSLSVPFFRICADGMCHGRTTATTIASSHRFANHIFIISRLLVRCFPSLL